MQPASEFVLKLHLQFVILISHTFHYIIKELPQQHCHRPRTHKNGLSYTQYVYMYIHQSHHYIKHSTSIAHAYTYFNVSMSYLFSCIYDSMVKMLLKHYIVIIFNTQAHVYTTIHAYKLTTSAAFTFIQAVMDPA